MNNWNAIKQHYDWARPVIMAERSDEWAIDPYAWDCGIMRLTPIEDWLWQDIRQANAVMYPQWPVNGVFLDFANPAALVAIECDGAAFHQDKEKDRRRDEKLEALGWRIRSLFHRQRFSVRPDGFSVIEVVAGGPVPGPTDDDKQVARIVQLRIRLRENN